MRPQLIPGEFVFCTVSGSFADFIHLEPLASFVEAEGLTLILPKQQAEAAGLSFQGGFRQITLQVHSSLEAVGLTAAVSARLTEHNISANVVAAYHHDHIFVPASGAVQALAALTSLTEEATI
jgi:hypothetical protein